MPLEPYFRFRGEQLVTEPLTTCDGNLLDARATQPYWQLRLGTVMNSLERSSVAYWIRVVTRSTNSCQQPTDRPYTPARADIPSHTVGPWRHPTPSFDTRFNTFSTRTAKWLLSALSGVTFVSVRPKLYATANLCRQTKADPLQIHTIAALNELELELPPPTFPDNPAEFMEKFPYGKIPAFEGTEGFKMIEGTAIARYCE